MADSNQGSEREEILPPRLSTTPKGPRAGTKTCLWLFTGHTGSRRFPLELPEDHLNVEEIVFDTDEPDMMTSSFDALLLVSANGAISIEWMRSPTEDALCEGLQSHVEGSLAFRPRGDRLSGALRFAIQDGTCPVSLL